MTQGKESNKLDINSTNTKKKPTNIINKNNVNDIGIHDIKINININFTLEKTLNLI